MSLQQLRSGSQICKNIRGFPGFLDSTITSERVITGDIWAYLMHVSREELHKPEAMRALSFIEQASDFYQAASNPRISSRPLLYYYAFLNLSKVLLLHQRVAVPPKASHGISDPRTNARQRLRLAGQVVKIERPSAGQFNIFSEVLCKFPVNPVPAACLPKEVKVLDLLAAVPAIHRTFCQVTNTKPVMCPIGAELPLFSDGVSVWTRIYMTTQDPDVVATNSRFRNLSGFSTLFSECESDRENKRVFESVAEPITISQEHAVIELAGKIRNCGLCSILTTNYGYSYYLNVSKRTNWLPQYGAAYGAMFYLGSITRYKPYDFDKIIDGFSWLISEFLDTQPTQMLHLLASLIADTEVVSPYAVRLGE